MSTDKNGGDWEALLGDEADTEFFDGVDAFALCAEENRWAFVFDAKKSTVELIVARDDQSDTIEIQFDTDTGVVTLMSLYQFRGPPHDMLALYECVNECNLQQSIGQFLYIREYVVITWRITLSLIGTPGMTVMQACKLIDYCTAALSRGRPKFAALAIETSHESVNRLNWATPTIGRA